jgi:hypothetical protein
LLALPALFSFDGPVFNSVLMLATGTVLWVHFESRLQTRAIYRYLLETLQKKGVMYMKIAPHFNSLSTTQPQSQQRFGALRTVVYSQQACDTFQRACREALNEMNTHAEFRVLKQESCDGKSCFNISVDLPGNDPKLEYRLPHKVWDNTLVDYDDKFHRVESGRGEFDLQAKVLQPEHSVRIGTVHPYKTVTSQTCESGVSWVMIPPKAEAPAA